MGQEIYSGQEGITHLENFLKKQGAKNIILFSGKNSLNHMPISKELFSSLKSFNLERFTEIYPNPTKENLDLALNFLKNKKFDMILAIGGGSVLDTAKISNFLFQNNLTIDDYINNNFQNPKPANNLIAIPTTAGTGSESTQFATFYINEKKYSLDLPEILPQHVILDPSFTSTLPAELTAQTGADALCHSIESFWSVKSTEKSRELAYSAISLLLKHLPNAVLKGDPQSREKVLLAANYAGQAINITRTTAAHSVSYPMTSIFKIPHGQAVSVNLPYLFQYNQNLTDNDCLDPRGPEFVTKRINELLNLFSTQNGKSYLLDFFNSIGLKTKLMELDINKKDIPILVKNGFTPNRVKNNPRRVMQDSLTEMLTSAL